MVSRTKSLLRALEVLACDRSIQRTRVKQGWVHCERPTSAGVMRWRSRARCLMRRCHRWNTIRACLAAGSCVPPHGTAPSLLNHLRVAVRLSQPTSRTVHPWTQRLQEIHHSEEAAELVGAVTQISVHTGRQRTSYHPIL